MRNVAYLAKSNEWLWAVPWRAGVVRFATNWLIVLVSIAALALVFTDPVTRGFFWEELTDIIFALVMARLVLTEGIRMFWKRQRPFTVLPIQVLFLPKGRHAFPSGHVAFFSALGFALLPILPLAGWMVLGATVLNGAARVVGGMHW